jgi:hypothetical protein
VEFYIRNARKKRIRCFKERMKNKIYYKIIGDQNLWRRLNKSDHNEEDLNALKKFK